MTTRAGHPITRELFRGRPLSGVGGKHSLRQQGILSLPFSRFPSGESRGGRVPPTPRTLPASKKRWHASMLRLPPQEGFQNAPAEIPLARSPCLRGQTRIVRLRTSYWPHITDFLQFRSHSQFQKCQGCPGTKCQGCLGS
jgi:hypothetical protein